MSMSAKQFLQECGKAEATRVAESAGTNYAYFSQIAYGHRRPSIDLAERLVDASSGRLGLVPLLKSRSVSA